ncbi:MAG: methionyl-tRNA formyltransferase [Bacteroidales bacterium]|nr:methionyl-tRNA formyltransferase [Bacteroidales bacterium]
MRIIYMGTPDFAVAPLQALVERGYDVVAVVTMPDKPAGRGHKLQASPVKQFALEHQLPVLQPERLKDDTFLDELRSYHADLQIVVAFRMLPEVVWNMPPKGTINLHASLLPQYRGAAPINWAIINGDTESGVTTFQLKHEIDTGAIIRQQATPITPDDNAGTLHDRLMDIGTQLVVETVDLIESGNYTPIPQRDDIELRPAPKIFKETCRLDFTQTSEQIHNRVRGLSPYPAALFTYTPINHEPIVFKVFETQAETTPHNYTPGTLITDNKKTLKIATADGYLHLRSLQMPGKKRMTAEELMRGFKFDNLTVNQQ